MLSSIVYFASSNFDKPTFEILLRVLTVNISLEGPIEIGEIFKPAPGGDGQDGLIRGLQRFGGGVQAVFVQKSDEAQIGRAHV